MPKFEEAANQIIPGGYRIAVAANQIIPGDYRIAVALEEK